VQLPDDRLAFASPNDYVVRLWDLSRATQVDLAGREAGIVALAVTSAGALVSASRDSTMRLWDVSSGRELGYILMDGIVTCLVALPNNRLVAGDVDGRLHWFEIVDAMQKPTVLH